MATVLTVVKHPEEAKSNGVFPSSPPAVSKRGSGTPKDKGDDGKIINKIKRCIAEKRIFYSLRTRMTRAMGPLTGMSMSRPATILSLIFNFPYASNASSL